MKRCSNKNRAIAQCQNFWYLWGMNDHSYNKDFAYTHNNPYHHFLKTYSPFVFRDNEAEHFAGNWNQQVFKRNAPLQVEIGTGYGHFMMEHCQKNPQINFIGMDYRFKRSFKLAKKLDTLEEKNFRYLRAKGERIAYLFGENEIDDIFYFFPDPWPKKRQQKKRLFNTEFLIRAHQVLKPKGKIYIKTDHDQYSNQMEQLAGESSLFQINFSTKNLKEEHPQHFLASFETKFEKIFIAQGIKIKAFVLESLKE